MERPRPGTPDGSRTAVALVAALAVAVAAGLFFAELHEHLVEDAGMIRLDHRITDWMVDHRTGVLDLSMRVVTQLAAFWVVIPVLVVAVVLLVRRGHRGLAWLPVAASAGAWLLVNSGKVAIDRPRPPEAVRLVAAHGSSFPSGHAAQSVAVYGALAVVVWCVADGRRTRVLALAGAALVAVLVGVSRVYLGVHWTSDVLAGWSLALAVLATLVAVGILVRRRRLRT